MVGYTARSGLPVFFLQKSFAADQVRVGKISFAEYFPWKIKDFLWILCRGGSKKTRKMKNETKKTKMLMSFKNTFCNKNRQRQAKTQSDTKAWNVIEIIVPFLRFFFWQKEKFANIQPSWPKWLGQQNVFIVCMWLLPGLPCLHFFFQERFFCYLLWNISWTTEQDQNWAR